MSRILIVDDNAQIRRVLSRYLGSHSGWEICGVAEDGQQAVQRAAELRPDLIVMDFSMPVLDGLQATRQILNSLPATQVLIFTIDSLPQLPAEAEKAGARRVVTKSDGMPALASAIETLLHS